MAGMSREEGQRFEMMETGTSVSIVKALIYPNDKRYFNSTIFRFRVDMPI